ncbi:MAG: MATE family efflux transporter [Spirochaetaceae bacterium]|jgi:putative MATE family efflux protein|nr:MATE family efflux transporter [Spirochaetaceae bacterium]
MSIARAEKENKKENQAEKEKPQNVMGTQPINRLLLSMSIPMMLSMMVQALYNIVDSIFVAKIGENALNAVTLAFPVQNIMIGIGVGTGVGINALLSKSLGERNFERVNKAGSNGFFLVWISAGIFAVAGAFLSEWYFRIQTDIEEIITMGKDYLFVVCVFSVAIFTQVTLERLLASTGKTFYAMVSQLSGAAVNIILDPIMIFGLLGFPALGVLGAAIATVIGQTVACAVGFYLNQSRNQEISLSFKGFRPDGWIIKNIYAVGLSSILMQAAGSIMFYGINQILLSFTATATAVFGVFFRLQSFLFMPVFGLNNAMVPIIAFNYGARRRSRITKTIRLSMLYAGGIMIFGLLLFQLFPDKMLLLFSAGENMLTLGIPAMRIVSLIFLFAGFCIIGLSVFQAMGSGTESLIIAVCRQLVILLPAAWLLSFLGDINAVWWAFPIAEVVSLTLCVIFLKRLYIRKIKPLP